MDKATKMAERIARAERNRRILGARQNRRKAQGVLRAPSSNCGARWNWRPKQAGRLLDLAKFLAKQGRFQESDQAFQAAEKVEPNSPKVMFAKADTYIHNGRNLDTARKLLRQYLSATLTPDDPPRAQAEKLLKQAGS